MSRKKLNLKSAKTKSRLGAASRFGSAPIGLPPYRRRELNRVRAMSRRTGVPEREVYAVWKSLSHLPKAERRAAFRDHFGVPAVSGESLEDMIEKAEKRWRKKAKKNPRRYRTSRQKKKLSGRFTVFHADHGIKPAQMRHIQSRLEDMAPQGFFIKQVSIPKRLGPVPNALYGPASGDAPVSESEVRYMDRSGRGWEDRMVDLPVRPDNKVQAIGIRNGDEFTLFTVYGGPLAPQNPADPGNPDPEGAKRWWSQHALSTQQWAQNNPSQSGPGILVTVPSRYSWGSPTVEFFAADMWPEDRVDRSWPYKSTPGYRVNYLYAAREALELALMAQGEVDIALVRPNLSQIPVDLDRLEGLVRRRVGHWVYPKDVHQSLRRNPMSRKSDRAMAREILFAINDTVVEAGAEGVPESIIFMVFGSQGVPRHAVQKFVNALVSGGRLRRRNNVLYASRASMAAAEGDALVEAHEEGLFSSPQGRDQTIRDLARHVMRHMQELNKQYEEGIRPRPATFDRAWDELSRSRVFLASDQGLKDDVRRAVKDDIRVEEYELRKSRRNPMRRNPTKAASRRAKARYAGRADAYYGPLPASLKRLLSDGTQAPFVGERYDREGSTFKGFQTRAQAKKFARSGRDVDPLASGMGQQVYTGADYLNLIVMEDMGDGFFYPLAVGESLFVDDVEYNYYAPARLDMNPRRNPMRRNAGRHFRRGKKVRDHGEFYMGAYEGDPTLFSMSKDELVDLGTAAAIKELRRRGRDADGVKLAWKR